MPLIISGRKDIKLANKDIHCFKLFKNLGNGVFGSMFAKGDDFKYSLGELYSTDNEIDYTKNIISDGYFHFWKHRSDAIEVLNININLNKIDKNEIVVLDCIIPKGSFYYDGMAGCYESLASSKMILNKIDYFPKIVPKINFKEPTEKEIEDYWKSTVSKDFIDPQNYNEKRRNHTKILLQIYKYHEQNRKN